MREMSGFAFGRGNVSGNSGVAGNLGVAGNSEVAGRLAGRAAVGVLGSHIPHLSLLTPSESSDYDAFRNGGGGLSGPE